MKHYFYTAELACLESEEKLAGKSEESWLEVPILIHGQNNNRNSLFELASVLLK